MTSGQPLFERARRGAGLLFVSGQLPVLDEEIVHPGTVGDGVTIEQAQTAARVAMGNCLAVVRDELGSLDGVDHVVKLNGYVACTADFAEHATVIDAASEMLIAELGEAGRHARLSIGVASLPRSAPVELELIVSVLA